MAAYAFARLRWPGRDMVFGLFLAALMVPPIFTALPNFMLIKNLGLLNTLPGMVLPFLLHDPVRDLLPAAVLPRHQPARSRRRHRIDGASTARIFFRIILPMSAAPITTLAILTFIAAWNDYFWPLLVGNTEGCEGPHRGAGRLPQPDPAGQPRTGPA